MLGFFFFLIKKGEEMLHILIFSSKIGSQVMCHHLMRSIVWRNVSPSHGIVTYHLGTNFWRKRFGINSVFRKAEGDDYERIVMFLAQLSHNFCTTLFFFIFFLWSTIGFVFLHVGPKYSIKKKLLDLCKSCVKIVQETLLMK
jgi:hypothetical protein